MTTTTGIRQATPDEALTSVAGYLQRVHGHLYNTLSDITPPDPAALRELSGGLHIIASRLSDAAAAYEFDAATIPVYDTAAEADPQLDIERVAAEHWTDGDC